MPRWDDINNSFYRLPRFIYFIEENSWKRWISKFITTSNKIQKKIDYLRNHDYHLIKFSIESIIWVVKAWIDSYIEKKKHSLSYLLIFIENFNLKAR